MRIVIGSTQPDVQRALQKTNSTVMFVRSTLEFEYESARAGAAFLDLRDAWVKEPRDVVQRALLRHPFLKLSVIINPLCNDPKLYFALGQMGVAEALTCQSVSDERFWRDVQTNVLALDAIERFQRQVRPYLADREHPLLTLFLPNVHKASVKQLSQTVLLGSEVSTAAKRRTLWSTCQRAGLVPPEAILSGLRVLFIKSVLDDNAWTAEQLARYLDVGSPRAMWRSVKRRTGLSPKALLQTDRAQLFTQITKQFFERG